jgi:hypothetical protein
MSTILFTEQVTPASPSVGKVRLFIDNNDSTLKSVDFNGVVTTYGGALTTEQIQDLVGAFISAGSTKVLINYNDVGNILTIDIDETQIDHTALLNIGTNTHSQIDTHLASTLNPHSVTKTQVGLSNVPNLDTSNPANITQDITHRFATDTEKSTWNGKQDSITGAATTITASNLTASKALTSDVSGKVAVSSVSSTELGYISGVTSAIQTQLGNKVTGNTSITGATATKLTYDSKGLVTSGTQASLNDLSDVLYNSPILDEVLKWNGTKFVNGNPATVNAGAGVAQFLSVTASGIGAYELMSKSPDSNTEIIESIVVNNNTVLLEGYIGDAVIGGTQIDAGIWEFNLYSYVDTIAGVSNFVIEIYTRTSGGTETLLFSLDSQTINSTSIILTTSQTVQPSFTCNATDKLLFKIYGKTTNTSNTIVYLVHSGTVNYSHFHTPLVTRHNDLAGLQGGTTGQQYHLTSSEYTGTGTGNFVRALSPNITTPTGIVKSDVGLSNVDNTSDTTKNSAAVTLTNKAISGSSNTLSNIGYSSLSLTGSIVNTDISVSADIALSKLATVTTGKTLQSNITTGLIEASSVTNTELGYLSGVTSALQTQLSGKAPLVSPALTGTPSAPTATLGTYTTQIATTAFVLANIGTPPDATTIAKGIVQLSGDLAGTAAAPSVVKIRGSSVSATAPSDGETLVWNSATSEYAPQGPVTTTTVNTVSDINTQLTNTSNYYQIFIGSVPGQRVTLPDATTIGLADDFFIINDSSTIIPVYNFVGTLQGIVYPQMYGEFMLTVQTTSAGEWFNEIAFPNYQQQSVLYDDFINSGTSSLTIGMLGWAIVTGTGGNVTYSAGTANDYGVVTLSSGTSTTTGAAIHLGNTATVAGGGISVFEYRIRVPVLSTVAQEFNLFIGTNNNITTNAVPTNGIFFSYERITSVNWLCNTTNGGTRTTVTSTIPIVANTWFKLTGVVNAAGTQVDFYINGTFVGSSTTNITTSTIAPNLTIRKTVGTTAMTVGCDYFYHTKTFSVIR